MFCKNTILLSILFAALAGSIFGGERYDLRSGLSIELPNMPIREDAENVCRQFAKERYLATDGATIYDIAIVYKRQGAIPGGVCSRIQIFDQQTMTDEMEAFRGQQKDGINPSATRWQGFESIRYDAADRSRIYITQWEKDRWIEIGVFSRTETAPQLDKFLATLELGGKSGKDVGDGAEFLAVDANAQLPGYSEGRNEGIRFIHKPRARYTEKARRKNTQGSVRLKVMLLANGTVGEISPVNELPNGLTENAVASARRLVFLPKIVNGRPVASAVTLEYGFSLY